MAHVIKEITYTLWCIPLSSDMKKKYLEIKLKLMKNA